jgi:hypothetical protein
LQEWRISCPSCQYWHILHCRFRLPSWRARIIESLFLAQFNFLTIKFKLFLHSHLIYNKIECMVRQKWFKCCKRRPFQLQTAEAHHHATYHCTYRIASSPLLWRHLLVTSF